MSARHGHSPDDSGDRLLRRVGLTVRVARTEALTTHYDCGLDVLRSLKLTGAWIGHGRDQGPLSVGELRRLLRHYEERHRGTAGVPMTFEVLYLVAEAAQ